MTTTVSWFDELTRVDTPTAGGKGANLGELVVRLGILHDAARTRGPCP